MPKIIAHRGASNEAPENTLASIELAWAKGANAVEVDIHLTKDQEIVLMHDDNTLRTSGMDLVIKDNDYKSLSKLDVGSWKKGCSAQKIPLFRDLLETVPEQGELFIEIKSDKNIVSVIKEQMAEYPHLKNKLYYIAFDLEVLIEINKSLRTKCCLLAHEKSGSVKELIDLCHQHQLTGLDLDVSILTPEVIDLVKDNNLELFTWTVNKKETMSQLMNSRIDGITTDIPDLAW